MSNHEKEAYEFLADGVIDTIHAVPVAAIVNNRYMPKNGVHLQHSLTLTQRHTQIQNKLNP